MSDLFLKLVSEHGPWVLLVFYLLWRDLEKDKLARTLSDKNTAILVELSTIIRERLPDAPG